MDKAKRIEELEQGRFYLSMKDHWSAEDYAQDRKWAEEIRKLKEEIGE